MSQLTVKEFILNSAPNSCELDPIPSKLLIECLDSILPSLTDLFNSSLASGIFPQCFKSALVTPILKKMCLDHNDLNNYRPVSNLCFIAKILEKLTLELLILSFNGFHLIRLIVHTTSLYVIIALILLLYTQVFLRVQFLALYFSPCILSLCLPLLTHTLSYIIHLLMTYNYRCLLPQIEYMSYFTLCSNV